jgi:C2H2 type zinc-finger (2 copies)
MSLNSSFWTNKVLICPLCQEPDFFSTIALALDHLQFKHQIRIAQVSSLIPFLEFYIERKALDYNQEETVWGSVQENDAEIRSECRQKKLTEILKIQESERKSLLKELCKCLFCKLMFNERLELFEHFRHEHGFIIGHPDNLVMVDDFLNMLDLKIQACCCIFCEKTFPDHITFRKHLRKKKHFQVNPRNRDFDRFYLVNYQEKETIPSGDEQDLDQQDEEDFEEWEDDVDENTMCLFDESVFNSPEECYLHMKSAHSFDIFMFPDVYDRIKLVNYVRRKHSQCICACCDQEFPQTPILLDHLSCHRLSCLKENSEWKDAKYLMPFFENDPLLMLSALEDD